MNIDIEEQYDKIYRYCYFKLKNEQQAEDLTQETFLRFLESDRYKDTGRPLAYLYTIARNLCIDEFRKIPTEELREETTQNLLQESFENAVVRNITLHEAMKILTQEEQEMLLLRYVNDVPLAEIGNMHGKSRFAVYRELTKITRKLERRISDGTKNEAGAAQIL